MQGTVYLSKIREDLTFEVLNLYPDYDYPGKIKSININIDGEPEQDKVLTLVIKLHTLEGVLDGASKGFLRLTSEAKTTKDMYVYPIDVDGNRVNSSDTLKGSITFSNIPKLVFGILIKLVLQIK